MSAGRLGRASALLFAATLVVNVSMLLYHRHMSQNLGDDYAQLLAVLAVVNVLANITLGLNTFLVKTFSADAELRGPGAVLGRLQRLGKQGGLLLAGLMLLLLALSPLLAGYLRLEAPALSMLAVMLFGGGVVLLALRAAVQGLHRFDAMALSLALEGLGRLAGAWMLAAKGALGGLLAILVGQAAGAVGVARGLRGKVDHDPALASPPRSWKKSLREASGDTLVLTLFALMAFLDMLVLKHHYSEQRASLYGRAALVAKSFLYLAGALNMVLLPAAARAFAGGRDPRRLLAGFLGMALAVNLAGLAFVWAYTPFCLRLLAGSDPAFQAVAPLVRSFSLAVIPLALLQLVLSYLLAIRAKGVLPGMAVLTFLYWLGLEMNWHSEFKAVAALGVMASLALALGLAAALWRRPQSLQGAL